MNADDLPPADAPDDAALPPLPEVTPYAFLQERADEEQAQARQVDAFIDDLRTNPRYRPWLEQFHPDSIGDFIRHYALEKGRVLRYGDSSTRWLQERITEYTDAAYERLWDIQQKKLFDLQCRWRAEQVTVPGIDVSAEFEDWGSDSFIYRCPFLEPITAEEFELYCQFVATTTDFEDDVEGNDFVDWQNYEEYRDEYLDKTDGGMTMPEWYHFHNARCGTAVLMSLPDVRGTKEERYLKVAREAFRAKREKARAEHAAAQAATPPDPRPRLSYAEQDARTLEFAAQFEPGKVQRLFAAYQQANKNHNVSGLEEALETLQNAHEDLIPIEAHADWRQAILRAAANYRRQRLLEALPVVYDEYLTRQRLGIAHPPLTEYESKFRAAKFMKKQILKGRRLLGEPEDFDF
ncbi:hypothetical protein Q5H93_20995 [Hymenobacter sp. ASUV-10]|uniref:Uncharacterized protein n=1 Tax=Hymenobacter aranciens TaxID=3063996 RepID=A0ABT9BG37_9BACT|nr:hypothetical protein [Hymenobacter sp. ASUV-10]MDO7877236.1 hypothetical protein [Hymenobacter sp. ASUV-10]